MTAQNNNKNRVARPSDRRREYLNSEIGIGSSTVSNFFPIERYYDAAIKVYNNFEDAFKQQKLDDAYVFGKRYCLFCLEAIPHHNYYKLPKYTTLRLQHIEKVQEVMEKLEIVTELMDKEEAHKEKLRQAAFEKQRKELEERKRIIEAKKFEELQRRMQKFSSMDDNNQKQQTDDSATTCTAEESAIKKLEMLRNKLSSTPSEPTTQKRKGSSRYALDYDDDDDEGVKSFPPPLLPPPPSDSLMPPSYHQIASSPQEPAQPPPPGYDELLKRKTPFAPDPPSGYNDNDYYSRKQQQKKQKVPVRIVKKQYTQEYMQLQRQNRIQIQPIGTYQGRVRSSTNGCTVISALCVAFHLAKGSGSLYSNIEDRDVINVIDNQCGPILSAIRSKLGLHGDALIIPSDVHDHLVDRNILKQDDFVGVAGGDVLNQQHIQEVLNLLSQKDAHVNKKDSKPTKDKKSGATFFFHEHVVSIVQCHIPGQQSPCYDLIDSLPSFSTGHGSACTRTRCTDISALNSLLNWYTTRKFSESNCSYIDNNRWDENMADFDPRVFQAFVWAR